MEQQVLYLIIFSVTAIMLVKAEEGWQNFQINKNPAGAKRKSGGAVSFVPEDGVAPPPWFLSSQQEQSGFGQGIQTQIKSFFDDESSEFPQPWSQLKANPVSRPPVASLSSSREKPSGDFEQPTSKHIHSTVKEPTAPAVKLPVAPTKQPVDLYYHAQVPVKPIQHQQKQTDRPQYFSDSSEYYYDYYDDEEVPASFPDKDFGESYFEKPGADQGDSLYRPSFPQQRPKPIKNNQESHGFDHGPLLRAQPSVPPKYQNHDWSAEDDQHIPEQHKKSIGSTSTTIRPKSSTPRSKHQQNREKIPAEKPGFDDQLTDYPPSKNKFEQPKIRTSTQFPPSTTSRSPPKSKPPPKQEVSFIPDRFKSKKPQQDNVEGNKKYQPKPEYDTDFNQPEDFSFDETEYQDEQHGSFPSSPFNYPETDDPKHVQRQPSRRPTESHQAESDIENGSNLNLRSNDFNTPSPRPSGFKVPSSLQPKPEEPIDIQSLAVLKNIAAVATTKRPIPKFGLGRKPDDGVKAIKIQQEDTRSAEPNLNQNQQEDGLNPIDLSLSVVQPKPSRPNLKDRLSPNHQKPATPGNGPSKTNDHGNHSEDEEDLFPPAKTHSDNVASEPKDSYDENSDTGPKTDEDTVSSTLFPPFSKRIRTTTPSPAVGPLPSIKAGNESASPFGQSRITSYKQRIEAMKEKARQKEQQAQPQQKQEPEILEEVQEVSSTTTSSTTLRPSTTRPKTPPRMPTRKPLFSSTTTTTVTPSIPEEDYRAPGEQSTKRFKPKFSKPSDATEPLLALDENQPEQPPIVPEQVDESIREGINTPKEGDFKNINVRLRGKHRPTGNIGHSSTTIQPDLFNEKNPSDVFPQLALDTSVNKQEDGKEDGLESIDISSHQPPSESRENTESEDHHHSAHHHHDSPAELRATLSQVVPLSPDLSDPVSKARKQFFAMATHDPMLPIEELLNIRVRDNGKGM